MPKKEYGWEDGALPEIAPHSLAKHRILREYVQRYLRVLTAAPGMETFRLWLVDGFAGGGEYVDRSGNRTLGSPLILLDAVRDAELSINASRSKPLRIDAEYVFVEKSPKVMAHLEQVLLGHAPRRPSDGRIHCLTGGFEQHLDGVISRIKARGRAHRAIFLLDQYGYTGVPAEALRRIFQELPNAEVFLTLAVGWITAYLPDARSAADKLGITVESLCRLAEMGDDGFDIGDPGGRPSLFAIQRLLHHAYTTGIGCRYYTPFFIVSRESNRPYWFLHMANSARANDVVKVLHWEVENHFAHFGHPGFDMLGYDPDQDPAVTSQMAFDFTDTARDRTHVALLDEIPRRLANSHAGGVTFETLFETVCNETPATKEQLGAAIRDLCIARELEKRGGSGERRAPSTLPHDEDVVVLARQILIPFRR